jgi:pyruvate kinase
MSLQKNSRLFERLIPSLQLLRDEALRLEQSFADELSNIEPLYRPSARNLLHYLGLRRHDIRNLQRDLHALGLSSLGILEAHTLASLNAVLDVLGQLTGRDLDHAPEPPVDFRTGPLLLRDHTRTLLGPDAAGRNVRIMVTMPSEAATAPALVRDLLVAGMDVMRINCAHDDPAAWRAMVDNLRRAEREVGRSCRVQADLAGPKLRTGRLEVAGRVLKIRPTRDYLGRLVTPAPVWLTPADAPADPPAGVTLVLPVQPGLLDAARAGDELHLQDGRARERFLRLVARHGESLLAEAERVAYVLGDSTVELLRDGEVVATGTVGSLPAVVPPITLFPNDQLLLLRADEPGRDAVRDDAGTVLAPARIHCTLAAAFESVHTGQSVWLDDGKIGGIVTAHDAETITVKITHTGPNGAKLRAEKGINFPDTQFAMSALTAKDIADLKEVVGFVDMVALSFLRGPEDILLLEDHLHRLGAGHLGIVLKIENRQAFENLPRILLASLRSPPVGVMVARGDLAVEVGFERLSEVQEEILWLCEAAHVPVIWATQILEGMAKKGAPSRAEISDAVMSSRAECAMLNKGPYIVETVRFLSGILSRMDQHLDKRMAMLRRLSVSELR